LVALSFFVEASGGPATSSIVRNLRTVEQSVK
jgi:hypothetical protein